MTRMPHDLPEWVAELTDPRRAQTLDELADRLVPLAEHAIDVSRRLQALLNELNEPFKREALYGRVDRLKTRADEAFAEISAEISAAGEERAGRLRAACAQAAQDGRARSRYEARVVPELTRQERVATKAANERVAARTSVALEEATQTLLTRVEELAKWVTDLIHDVLPLAREGLELASRISGLSSRSRGSGRGPVPAELRAEAAAVSGAFDEAVGRLELEWASLGARSASVRAALRGAEETAFSHVTAELTRCVEELAPAHMKALNEAEARAMSLLKELSGS
jgi:hypothetical protein